MSITLTKNRQRILNALKNHHGTVTATELHARLPEMDLATIYRNLDLFTKEKLIKRVTLATAEAQYEYQPEPHQHAVCVECQRVVHFTVPEPKLTKLFTVDNFVLDDLEVTLRGHCQSCR